MPVQTNAKRVIKIYKGDTKVYTDTTTWFPLKLGTGVTGMALCQLTGNGYCSLVGDVTVAKAGNVLAIYPPDGYAFTGIFSNGLKTIQYIPQNQLLSDDGRYNGSDGLYVATTLSFTGGAIYMSTGGDHSMTTQVPLRMGATGYQVSDTTASAPLTMSIKDV